MTATAAPRASAGPAGPAVHSWESYLLSEAWSLRAVRLRAGRLLVTCTVPRRSGPGVPATLLYRRTRNAWTLRGQIPWLSRPGLIGVARLAGLHRHEDQTRLCSFAEDGSDHRELARLSGPVRAVAYQDQFAAVLMDPPADPFAPVRKPRLDLVALDDITPTKSFELDLAQAEPTGELVAAEGLIVLGTSQDHPDGRRHIGLSWLRPADGRTGTVEHPDRDLHGLFHLAGKGWAVRASTRHHQEGRPLRHETWFTPGALTSDSWTTLNDGRQTWLEPVGAGPEGLISLGVRRGVRLIHRPCPESGRTSVSSFVQDGRREAWVGSSPVSPPALWFRPHPEAPVELVDQGDQPPWAKAPVHRYLHRVGRGRYRHPTGSQVLLPPDGVPPRAVVAVFHGGPTMSWTDWSWRWNPGPYLQQGYAVVLVDPAGSDGYGSRSWRAAWRRWWPGIVPSAVETLTEARSRAGLTDLPLATVGGSFGGYLALAVAGRLPTVLAAAHATPVRPREVALTSAAFWSWTREWGPLLDRAAVLEPESLQLGSLTPDCRVLLSHGLLDDQVPFEQSVSAARELRMRGIPCELALIPGVGHSLARADWTVRWYKWVLDALNTRGISTHGGESGTTHGRRERP